MSPYSPEDLCLAALAELAEVGPFRVPKLLCFFGAGRTAWEAGPGALAAALGLQGEAEERLRRAYRAERPEELAGDLDRLGVRLVGPGRLPPRLRSVGEAPAVLFVRGALPPAAWPAVAVVGTRRTDYSGLVLARRIAGELAGAGVVVVSGLARGVDGAAHEACLRAGGCPVAVLGSGIDVIYPPEHRRLYEEVAARGAVVSEFPPGAPPLAHHFPWRNRILSGLADGVVVVRAGWRSGAMITAECADRQGRLLFAVPGDPLRPCTAGSNFLLTHPEVVAVTSGYEILPWLPGLGAGAGWRALAPSPAGPRHPAGAGRRDGWTGEAGGSPEADGREAAEEERVVAVLAEPLGFDELAARTGVAAARLGALLVRLERQRRIRWLPGLRFVASHLDSYN